MVSISEKSMDRAFYQLAFAHAGRCDEWFYAETSTKPSRAGSPRPSRTIAAGVTARSTMVVGSR
jgi:hypothetical protein